MATQWITIAKIGGCAGYSVLERFQRWHGGRVKNPYVPSLTQSEQWPERFRQEADRFARDLDEHATESPVLFYSRYVDTWSFYDVFTAIPALDAKSIHTDTKELHCFDLADKGLFETNLRRTLRRRSRPPEAHWYARLLLLAANAYKEVDSVKTECPPASVIVVILVAVDVSRGDDTVLTALHEPSPF